jgi:hypothetical protein
MFWLKARFMVKKNIKAATKAAEEVLIADLNPFIFRPPYAKLNHLRLYFFWFHKSTRLKTGPIIKPRW